LTIHELQRARALAFRALLAGDLAGQPDSFGAGASLLKVLAA